MSNEITLIELEEKVLEAVKTVYDPEIPVNIHELGLVYDISVTESREVVILMTLTSPNCPVAGSLPIEVENKVKEIEEVVNAKVLITFDPPWDQSMMSEAAKLELGFL